MTHDAAGNSMTMVACTLRTRRLLRQLAALADKTMQQTFADLVEGAWEAYKYPPAAPTTRKPMRHR